MNVSKIAVNTAHKKWCQDFMNEQYQTTHMIRRLLKRSSVYNPFANNSKIDNILKRYEKDFWG